MRIPTCLLACAEPVPDRPILALWHEVGRRTRDDTTTTVFHTTPITVGRPVRGAVEAAVACRVCREPVRVRVVDAATARRRRICGNVLVGGQFLFALALAGGEVTTLASLGLRLGVLGWLVIVLPVMLAVLWCAEWAQHRAGGVTILRPRDTRHTLGSAGSAVVSSRAHAPSLG